MGVDLAVKDGAEARRLSMEAARREADMRVMAEIAAAEVAQTSAVEKEYREGQARLEEAVKQVGSQCK
jgi:hypothetical protein